MGVILNVQVFRGGQCIAAQQFDSDTNRTIKIGRLSSAQLKLDDPKVSRIHAVIEIGGAEVALHDMGTTEGTSVNGVKVVNTKLKIGDQITIGDTTLVIAAPGAAAPQAAAPTPPGAAFAAPGFATGPAPGMRAPSFGAPAPGGAPFGAPSSAFGAQPATFASAPAFRGATAFGGAPAFGAPSFGMPQGAPMAGQMPVAGTAALQPIEQGSPQPRFDPGANSGSQPVTRITGQRLNAAAVEGKPHPALPPEQQMTPENRILEMRLYWGEVLLGINHYVKPKKITIGETKKTNVFISSEGLPTEEFPLVRTIDDDYVLTFTKHMEGEVEIGKEVHALQALPSTSLARSDDSLSESYQVKMTPEARAIVHWGGATFALRFVAPSEGVPPAGFKSFDLQYINVALMSIFLHIALVVTFVVYPYDTESLREDLFEKPDRFVNLIIEPPKQTDSNKDLLAKLKKEVEEKKKEIEKKEKPPEPQKKEVNIAKVNVPVKPRAPTQAEKAQAVKEKFSKLFTGSGGGGQGSLLGGGGGGSLSGTLSNVIGTAGAGSAGAGMAGLGIRGTGPMTGGGVGTSRGIAGIGTSGRLGGGGLGYGSNVGLGARKNTSIDIGVPVVMGALAMEVIKKVIDENKQQIRYCYEVELQRNQNLEGRVQMKWVIAATGSVAQVKVRESTLNNPNVENCIMAKIKGWRFPAPAGGGIVEVNYPFIFKAS